MKLNRNCRILVPHSDLSPGDTYHEWYFTGDMDYRDAVGRERGSWGGYNRWLHVRCNNLDCHGAAIVSEDFVTGAITEVLAGAS